MYDLRVVVEEVKGFCDMPMQPGDYFEVKGGKIIVPDGKYICLWALQSMMPLLPLKQRKIAEENDWVPDTEKICCPDPNGMVIYRIETIDQQTNRENDGPKARLLVNWEKCTGCRACETLCSFRHTESFSGEDSRIRIEKNELQGDDIPYVCRQCGNASCVEACPTEALSRDAQTKAVLVDEEKCTGCKLCSQVCPFNSISFHRETGKALICDLCGGEPACVQRCPVGAITFGRPGQA